MLWESILLVFEVYLISGKYGVDAFLESMTFGFYNMILNGAVEFYENVWRKK